MPRQASDYKPNATDISNAQEIALQHLHSGQLTHAQYTKIKNHLNGLAAGLSHHARNPHRRQGLLSNDDGQ